MGSVGTSADNALAENLWMHRHRASPRPCTSGSVQRLIKKTESASELGR